MSYATLLVAPDQFLDHEVLLQLKLDTLRLELFLPHLIQLRVPCVQSKNVTGVIQIENEVRLILVENHVDHPQIAIAF